MANEVEDAEGLIRARLELIEAAIADIGLPRIAALLLEMNLLTPTDPEWIHAQTRISKAVENRVASLLLLLYHMKDDARRLARVKSMDPQVVEDFCKDSVPVALCIKAGNTAKHGVGGRDGNNTVISHTATTFHQVGDRPTPTDPAIYVMKIIVDENGDPHQADRMAKEAARSWVAFLEGTMGMELPEWRTEWTEAPLPPGLSEYTMPLPEGVLESMKRDARTRAQKANRKRRRDRP